MIKVLYNEKILPDYYKLGINRKPLPIIQPGQFVMLRINGRLDPLLRRPFGVYKILGQGSRVKGQGIEIVYKVVGKGTKLMTGLKPGNSVDVLGPLGNGFLAPKQGHKTIMVAGGIGIAPFYLIAANGHKTRIKLLFGGRSKDDLPGLGDFQKLGIDLKISTDDGSVGEKGFVTELLKKELKTMPSKVSVGGQNSKLKTVIYACGPKGMLKAVAKMAADADVLCYVSLDAAMACGIGACLGCAIKVRGQESGVRSQNKSTIRNLQSEIYKMVCKDGPVFDARDIAWEEI